MHAGTPDVFGLAANSISSGAGKNSPGSSAATIIPTVGGSPSTGFSAVRTDFTEERYNPTTTRSSSSR